MTYRPLDEKTIVDYMRERPALGEVFSSFDHLSVSEVGDGNLNLVFVVGNEDAARSPHAPGESVVLKQALPFLRVAGESWPLTRERMRYEVQALLKHHELAPGRVPVVYDHDDEMSLVVMEHLKTHEIMRKSLVARERFPQFVDHITTFLVNSLFFTSDLFLTGPEKKLLAARFVNEQLRKLQEDFVYTNPYKESPENHWNPQVDAEVKSVRANGPLKMEIAEMKQAYMTHAEALIHADLHTGSIMLNAEDTRVIDPEFAFFGPIAYDVGAVIQNLILNYLSHFAHTPDKTERASYQAYLLDTVRGVWNEFARKWDEVWTANNCGELVPSGYWEFTGGEEAFAEYRRRYIHRLLQDMAGHGGTKFLRRMMGIVSVWDFNSIADPEKRAVAERVAIRIGTRWVMERRAVNSIDDLVGIVEEEVSDVTI